MKIPVPAEFLPLGGPRGVLPASPSSCGSRRLWACGHITPPLPLSLCACTASPVSREGNQDHLFTPASLAGSRLKRSYFQIRLTFKAPWDPGLADPHFRGHCSDHLLAPGLVCHPWGAGSGTLPGCAFFLVRASRPHLGNSEPGLSSRLQVPTTWPWAAQGRRRRPLERGQQHRHVLGLLLRPPPRSQCVEKTCYWAGSCPWVHHEMFVPSAPLALASCFILVWHLSASKTKSRLPLCHPDRYYQSLCSLTQGPVCSRASSARSSEAD